MNLLGLINLSYFNIPDSLCFKGVTLNDPEGEPQYSIARFRGFSPPFLKSKNFRKCTHIFLSVVSRVNESFVRGKSGPVPTNVEEK